jgi:hypothetical protein
MWREDQEERCSPLAESCWEIATGACGERTILNLS